MTCPPECKVELEKRVRKGSALAVILVLFTAVGSIFLYVVNDRIFLENKVAAAETKVQRTIEDVSDMAKKQDIGMERQAAIRQDIGNIKEDIGEIRAVNKTILFNQVEAVKQMRKMIKEALEENHR